MWIFFKGFGFWAEKLNGRRRKVQVECISSSNQLILPLTASGSRSRASVKCSCNCIMIVTWRKYVLICQIYWARAFPLVHLSGSALRSLSHDAFWNYSRNMCIQSGWKRIKKIPFHWIMVNAAIFYVRWCICVWRCKEREVGRTKERKKRRKEEKTQQQSGNLRETWSSVHIPNITCARVLTVEGSVLNFQCTFTERSKLKASTNLTNILCVVHVCYVCPVPYSKIKNVPVLRPTRCHWLTCDGRLQASKY